MAETVETGIPLTDLIASSEILGSAASALAPAADLLDSLFYDDVSVSVEADVVSVWLSLVFDGQIAFELPGGFSIRIGEGDGVTPMMLAVRMTGRLGGGLQLHVGRYGATALAVMEKRSGRWSAIAILSARLPGLPVGLGFYLDGLGGVLGAGRSADVDRLRSGLRDHTIDAVLFPDSLGEHALDLIDRLGAAFPAAEGRFLLGPMAKIGWGVPRMVNARLALLLDLPSPVRLLLLGRVDMGLPTLTKRTIDIRIDLLGVLDSAKKLLALDAALHDSRLAGYPLCGDMALRLGWGDDPQLLLSIGGFHPHFTPPPGFPALRRLSFTAGDNPQLRMECYLALTSNTAQVGAHADLTASGGGFEIKAHVGFDALFEFVPFHFEADIAASASIAWHGHHLLGVGLDFVLTGPHPWHAKGDATFSVLWWDVSVGFDTTWGDATPEPLQAPPDVGAALTDALGRAEAWSGELAPREPPWVVFGDAGADATTVHPFAALVVHQPAVPLDYDISAFGNIPLTGSQRFAIAKNVEVGTTGTTSTSVSDAFAPGQFTQLTSDEKLTAPSFETFHSGVRIAADEVRVGADARASMEVQTIEDDPLAPPTHLFPPIALPPALGAIAAVVCPTGRPPVPPRGGPRLGDLAFMIASTDDLSITAEGAAIGRGGTTYAGLREALRGHVAQVGRAPRLQVVPRIHVANANARVVVVREDQHMRNVEFVDTVTGRLMTRAEFVDAIHAGEYRDYLVRNINGVPTPVSRPNETTADNLG